MGRSHRDLGTEGFTGESNARGHDRERQCDCRLQARGGTDTRGYPGVGKRTAMGYGVRSREEECDRKRRAGSNAATTFAMPYINHPTTPLMHLPAQLPSRHAVTWI